MLLNKDKLLSWPFFGQYLCFALETPPEKRSKSQKVAGTQDEAMWSTVSLAWPVCFYLAPFCSGTRMERCGAHLGTITQIWAYLLTNLLHFLHGGSQ
jgi:hypothetical protein